MKISALDIRRCRHDGAALAGAAKCVSAESIANRVVDAVRVDVSWTGDLTGASKAARLAEAFHMNCEIHTTIFHTLKWMNPHPCGAVQNNSYLEALWPLEKFRFGLKGDLPIEYAVATLPESPRLGLELDWDFSDNCTLREV